MRRLTVFVPQPGHPPQIDNTRHLARVLYRWQSYGRIVRHSIGRIPLVNLVRTQFPYLLPDARVPPSVTVELTNICNLACTYCTSSLALRPQGMMTDDTAKALVNQLRSAGVKRVRFVGNGEATLHPQFASIAGEIARVVPFVTLITNAQRMPDAILRGICDAPITMVEVSVDGADAPTYEQSRLRGNFERLLANLTRLRDERDRTGSSTLINLRLMMRPSHATEERRIEDFWRPYADSIMKQYVIKRRELDDDPDVYQNVQRPSGEFPRCTLPFKEFDITWTGDVPLCHYSAAQVGEPGLILGNINSQSITELWNSPLMRQYRQAHRNRDKAAMPICSGCSAV